MSSINKGSDSDPLENFTEEQIANLKKSIDTLEKEEERWYQEQSEEEKRKKSANIPFRRLRKSPLEIFNRILFIIFLGSFLFSFATVYAISHWWFYCYVASAFSCILYPPNRKAIKELIAAWPNIEDLIKSRKFWRK